MKNILILFFSFIAVFNTEAKNIEPPVKSALDNLPSQLIKKTVNCKTIIGYQMTYNFNDLTCFVQVVKSELKTFEGRTLHINHKYWFKCEGWEPATTKDLWNIDSVISEMPNELKKPCTVSKISKRNTNYYTEITTYELKDQILNITERVDVQFTYDRRWSNDSDRKNYGSPIWPEKSWFYIDGIDDKSSLEGIIRSITRENKRCNGYVYW